MNHYEIVFLVHPDQSEQVPAMIDRYKAGIEKVSGKIHRQEDWGRRQMAYPIDKIHKAHYVLLNVECPIEAIDELEQSFRFNDAILRHLILRMKEAVTTPSPMYNGESSKESSREESSPEESSRGSAKAEAAPQESEQTKTTSEEE